MPGISGQRINEMHFGRVIWYNQDKEQGVIAVQEGDVSTRYFLLYSKILSAPVRIRAGHYAKFVSWQPAQRADLMPTAHAVTISETPFGLVEVLSGANVEAQKGGDGVQR